MNLYKILGVSQTATEAEIKKAYRELAKQYHPDHHGGDKHKESRFKEITAAHEVLGNREKRKAYNEKLLIEFFKPAPVVSVWPPSSPTPTIPMTPAEFPWQALLKFGLKLAGLGLLAVLADGGGSGGGGGSRRGSWDRTAQRRRGPDGRFRPSR